MDRPTLIPMERTFRTPRGEEIEDGGAGAAGCVIGRVVREGVGDAELVAVGFDEEAAFGVGLEGEGGDEVLGGGGFGGGGVGEVGGEAGREGGIDGGHSIIATVVTLVEDGKWQSVG